MKHNDNTPSHLLVVVSFLGAVVSVAYIIERLGVFQ